jgi:hypothetical protein
MTTQVRKAYRSSHSANQTTTRRSCGTAKHSTKGITHENDELLRELWAKVGDGVKG